MRSGISIRPQHFVLLLLILFFGATSIVWISFERAAPSWDDAWYLSGSLVLYDSLADGGLPGYLQKAMRILGSKAPLIAMLPTPFYLLAGRDPGYAYAVNLVFMVALVLSVYRLGVRAAGVRAGLIAAYVVGTAPLLYGLSRFYLMEYGLAALTAVAVLALEEELFLLFGVTFGLGMLMKVSFPLYVAVPVAVWGWRRWPLGGRVWLGVVPALLIALPWYVANYERALQTAVDAGWPSGEFYGDIPAVVYALRLLKEGPSYYYAALALGLVLWRRPEWRRMALPVGWMLPFVFFVFGPFREPRYTTPLLPGFALLVGQLAGMLPVRWIVAALAFPMIALLQVSFHTFGDWDAGAARYSRTYNSEPWPQTALLTRVGHGQLLVGSDTAHFNANNFELAALTRRMPVQISTTAYEKDWEKVRQQIQGASYFVYKEGGEGGSSFMNRHREAVLAEVRSGGDYEEVPEPIPLPDGGVAHLFWNVGATNVRESVLIPAGLPVVEPVEVSFGSDLQLTGLTATHSGTVIDVTYRWKALRTPGAEFWCFTHVLNEKGEVAGYLDHAIQAGNRPMTLWKPGDQVVEHLRLRSGVEAGGVYRLRLGVFHPPTGRRLRAQAPALPLTDEQTAVVMPIGSKNLTIQ